ncbi:MAG: hypothetical protein J6Y29_06205 [Clostridiales bacterium]|nr:hypothetical protein [Clostridiales bacterium]
MNTFIRILNKIFYTLYKIFRCIYKHWPKLRKIIVVFILLWAAIYKFSTPEIKSKINISTTESILTYEKNALSLKEKGELANALASYKNALVLILSQKDLSYLNINLDIQHRIYIDAAKLLLEYSQIEELSDKEKEIIPLLSDGLNELLENFSDDPTLIQTIADLKQINPTSN